ncbi:hypothetical protein [Roseicyclus marinus]
MIENFHEQASKVTEVCKDCGFTLQESTAESFTSNQIWTKPLR